MPPKKPTYAAIVDAQIERNRHEAEDWARFAAHRTRLCEHILADLPEGGRVAILGAGNGNDLDLEAISARAGEVHLVDLDAAALGRAVARTNGSARLHVHAPVDLTGDVLSVIAAGKAAARLDELTARALATVTSRLPRAFDLVVSDCVLSQIFFAAAGAVGPGSALAEDVCRALGRAHLRLLTRLCRPGGQALLACDMSSTAIYPPLGAWEEGDLGGLDALVRELAEARLHSVGTNPFLLRRAFRDDPELSASAEVPRLLPPWLWRVSDDDVFLVTALSWRTRAG